MAHAAAVARVDGALAGLALLEAIRDPAAQRFQPAWALRAHLLASARRLTEARAAFDRAIALTASGPARRYLERQRAEQAPADASA